MIKGVLFDMDGLLLDTERVCLETFVQTRRQFALPGNPETFMRCIGLRADRGDAIIRDSLASPDDMPTFIAAWHIEIARALDHKIPVKQGAAKLLQLLADRGLPMAVATSTHTAKACAHLEKAGLLPFFTHVVGGNLVTHGKPDPETYHVAAAQLGLRAADCAAFEDSNTGTRAAVASGARTVQVPDMIKPAPDVRALGHVIAPSLLEGAIAIGLMTPADI